MNVLKPKKNIAGGICIILSFFSLCAYADEVLHIKKNFVKENINGKIKIIKTIDSADKRFNDVSVCALKFIHENYALLSSEPDFIILACESVKKISVADDEDAAVFFEKIFAVNENLTLQKEILENLTEAAVHSGFKPSAATVQLVDAYTAKLTAGLQSDSAGSPHRETLAAAIKTLGQFKQASSFPVLFSCYASPDKAVSEAAARALDNFSGVYDKQIRMLISDGTLTEKRRALDLVLNNPQNSDFFKAEISENALSKTIYTTAENGNFDAECTALKMQAMRELYRVSWTRSPALMRDVFSAARAEYKAGFLYDNQFIEIIYAFARLASVEAVSHLSNYLKELNKNQEEHKPVSTPVVLAVIQSLQLLGDKTAFDDLLYTTYQNYPEEVISAARDALSKLKW
ncbi:HEAT repeat domain-containing protein [Treponema sp. OMZ 840]|uniref:HEAT repeat domain-containing protein n=1 Tax=Treponema sp. OMZ 840 TaxID=244313 RepID=UPI003D8FBEAF